MLRLPLIRIVLSIGLVLGAPLNLLCLVGLPSLTAQAQGNPQKVEADRLLQQGLQYLEADRFDAATQSFQQAVSIFQTIGERRGLAWAIANLGVVRQLQADYTGAAQYLQTAMEIAAAIPDLPLQGAIYRQRGLMYKSSLQYAKAIDSFQQELKIFQQLKARKYEYAALTELGNLYFLTGQLFAANKSFQQASTIAQALKDRNAEGVALNNLGLVYLQLGGPSEAIEYFQKALAIARETRTPRAEGDRLLGLSSAYRNLGNYSQATQYVQQALTIARRRNEPTIEREGLNQLGIISVSLGNYTEAMLFFQQSLELAERQKNQRSKGSALGNLGLAHRELGNYVKAKEYALQHLAIVRTLKSPVDEAAALSNLGLVEIGLKQYLQAIEYFQQSLTIAREMFNLRAASVAFGNLGEAYRLVGDYAKAMENLQQLLKIARVIKDRDSEGIALTNLGATWLQVGKFAEAEQVLVQGIPILESIRSTSGSHLNQVSLFEQQARTYGLLQAALIAQNKPEAALEIAERGRARAFVELLARRLTPTPTKISIAPPDLQQIRQIAQQQNATLVQYSVMWDQALFIWVIQPNGTITFRQVALNSAQPSTARQRPAFLPNSAQSEITQLVAETRRSLRITGKSPQQSSSLAFQPDPSQARKQLRRLHQLLIEPIADLLPTNPDQAVIFVPHGGLFFVPFPALQDADGTYLIEKHTLLTAPSIQVLELTRQQKTKVAKTGNSLVVGNPVMPKNLAPLPGAELEAQNIAQLLNTQPLLGTQATKATVMQKMPQARIIHLATHGLFSSNRGLGSSVALTPSGHDDGFLTAEEILNLKLAADLVVLSACDTGKGQLTADGVIGLSRSFIAAGTPSVLVSLWAVEDDSTAFLMTEFYRILQRQPNKATALRQAMLTTMRARPNPIDWAAFTLIGEAN